MPILVVTAILLGQTAPAAIKADQYVQAPAFQVRDLDGHPISNRTILGKTSVLFVFCECEECRRVAEAWSHQKRTQKVQTWVSYSHPIDEARSIASKWPGESNGIHFLSDPDFQIAERYRAMPCPAAVVVDSVGRLRYSSKVSAGETETNPNIIVRQLQAALSDVLSGRKVRTMQAQLSPEALLKFIPSQGWQISGSGVASTNVVVSVLDQEQIVDRIIFVRNTLSRPVRVDSVLTSCGCQEAGIVQGNKLVRQATIMPKSEAKVKVRVRLARQFSGIKNAHIWLMANGSPTPLATVDINISGSP